MPTPHAAAIGNRDRLGQRPRAKRVEAWNRLATDLDPGKPYAIVTTVLLEADVACSIFADKIRDGRSSTSIADSWPVGH